jgi:hypothetical protein
VSTSGDTQCNGACQMATDQSTGINLFGGLRVGCAGISLERSIRALAFLFDGWSRLPTGRTKTYEEPESGQLRVIAFTKLGRHFCRVWNNLFRLYQEKLKNILKHGKIDDLEDLITFSSPWNEISGPHGRQPGRYDSIKGPPIYMIEILFEMQKMGFLPYFRIVPPSENPDQPAHPKTKIMRGMEDPDEDHFLKGFTRKEKEILKDWKYSLQKLDGTKIRILGTHVNLRETIADIRYEFNKAVPLCANIIQKLKEHCCFLDDSYNLSRFSREANLKSRTNCNDYTDARKHMVDNIRINELRYTFEQSHKEPFDIWNTDAMSDIGATSRQAWTVARYFECVAYFRKNVGDRTHPNSKKASHFNHQWNKCCTEVETCNIQSLPIHIAAVFDGYDGDIKGEVRDTMIEVIANLNGKMKEMVERYKYDA